MKKLKLVCVGMLIVGLLLSTAIVLASPVAADQGLKPEKTIVPGAKPTEKAAEHAPDRPGKNVPGAKATEKADEPATQKPGQGKGPEKSKGDLEVYQGVVAAVGSQSLTLQLAVSETVTFVVSDTAKINVQGVSSHATLADVSVGARALVQARQAVGGSLIATHITVLPPQSGKRQRVGIVTAYTPGISITIQGKEALTGRDALTATQAVTTTYLITSTTVILPADRASELAVGSRVTIIAPAAAAKGSKLVAQGIVVHPANSDEEESEPTK